VGNFHERFHAFNNATTLKLSLLPQAGLGIPSSAGL